MRKKMIFLWEHTNRRQEMDDVEAQYHAGSDDFFYSVSSLGFVHRVQVSLYRYKPGTGQQRPLDYRKLK
ncbi:hypothetical protein D3C81_2039440 [compost metagenome]